LCVDVQALCSISLLCQLGRHRVSSGIDRGDRGDMPKSELRRAVPGVVLAAVAALAFYKAQGLSYGTAAHGGPGFAPTILSALLFILGLVVAAEGFWRRPIDGHE
jgi:hypothetical protein